MADYHKKHAPNARVGDSESKILFKLNKTGEWLDKLDTTERAERIQLARLEKKNIIAQEKQDRHAKVDAIRKRLQKSKDEKREKENRSRLKLEDWFSLIYNSGGLWVTEEEMHNSLIKMRQSDAEKLLKAHIHVRNKILRCKTQEKVLLSKSKQPQLEMHLKNLMKVDVQSELLDLYDLILDPTVVVGMGISHRWLIDEENGIKKWIEGLIIEWSLEDTQFTVHYEDGDILTLTRDQLITDIINEDLLLN